MSTNSKLNLRLTNRSQSQNIAGTNAQRNSYCYSNKQESISKRHINWGPYVCMAWNFQKRRKCKKITRGENNNTIIVYSCQKCWTLLFGSCRTRPPCSCAISVNDHQITTVCISYWSRNSHSYCVVAYVEFIDLYTSCWMCAVYFVGCCGVVVSILAFRSIGHGFESEHRLFSHHEASAFSKLRSLAKCSLDDSVRRLL